MLGIILVSIVKIVVVILGFVMPIASFLTWGERKWSAWMQDRVGPNRAGVEPGVFGLKNGLKLNGLPHILADGLKMMFKEDFEPAGGNKYLHFIAPLIALFPAIAAIVVVPMSGSVNLGSFDLFGETVSFNRFKLQIADLNVGLLFIFAISSLAPYASTIAGWASNNKFSLLGSLRTAAQMISYEVTLGLTLIGVMMIFETVQLDAIAEAQQGTFFGILPKWGIFMQPLGAVLFLACAFAENKRAPFDLPEGESEIVAGYFTEYSSMKFGMFFLGEFAEISVIAAFFSTLFLGGYHVPWMTRAGYSSLGNPIAVSVCVAFLGFFVASIGFNSLAPLLRGPGSFKRLTIFVIGPAVTMFIAVAFLNGNLNALAVGKVAAFFNNGSGSLPFKYSGELARLLCQALVFGVKALIMCWLLLVIRWTLPRFRYDQVMDLGWKRILPIALANVIVTSMWVVFA